MDQQEFLIQHLTEGKSYKAISAANNIPGTKLSEWWESGLELRKQIARSNQLFNARQNNENFIAFREIGKRGFYEWFAAHPKECYYCGIEEHKLSKLFDYETGILETKRGRGRTLELERRDAKNNIYSSENCVLACYLCNNHKSDLISEEDFLKYFAKPIREYLEEKFILLHR